MCHRRLQFLRLVKFSYCLHFAWPLDDTVRFSKWGYLTLIRWVMIFTISSMEGRWEGSLDQQRVIKLSMGFGRFLIKGGLVPVCKKEIIKKKDLSKTPYGKHSFAQQSRRILLSLKYIIKISRWVLISTKTSCIYTCVNCAEFSSTSL